MQWDTECNVTREKKSDGKFSIQKEVSDISQRFKSRNGTEIF